MSDLKSFKTQFVSPMWVFFILAVGACVANADDQRGIAIDIPTAFNYQGELIFNGEPANGTFDMIFGLFDTPASGMDFQFAEVSQTVFVTDGWFSTEVDFGDNTFFGERAWLEVIVIDPATLDEVVLGPRMAVNSVPYAQMAEQVIPNSITSQQLSNSAVRNHNVEDNTLRLEKFSTSGATAGDVIQFNGSTWEFAALDTSSPWQVAGSDISYTAGDVGVGTASPAAKFHFHGTADDEIRISGTSGAPALHFRRNNNGADWYLKIDPESNAFYFQEENDSVEKIMTINPSGEITRKKQVKTIYLGYQAFTAAASEYQFETANFLGMTGLKATDLGAGPAVFHSNLSLPADATITAFEMMAGDNSPAGAVVSRLGFHGFGSTNGGLVLSTVTSTNSPYGNVHSDSLDHAVSDDRSYYVVVELDAVDHVSQDGIFGGIRVTYETTVL